MVNQLAHIPQHTPKGLLVLLDIQQPAFLDLNQSLQTQLYQVALLLVLKHIQENELQRRPHDHHLQVFVRAFE